MAATPKSRNRRWPETGFEEKSIQPRKLAGQMNGDTTNRPSDWFPQRRGRL